MDQMGEGPSGPDPALPSGEGDGETTRASWGRYPVIRPGLADPVNPSLEPATDIAPGQPPTYIPPTYIPPRPQEMDQMGEGSSGPGGALPSGAGDGEATRTSWGRYPVIRPGLADPANPSLEPATDVAPGQPPTFIPPTSSRRRTSRRRTSRRLSRRQTSRPVSRRRTSRRLSRRQTSLGMARGFPPACPQVRPGRRRSASGVPAVCPSRPGARAGCAGCSDQRSP